MGLEEETNKGRAEESGGLALTARWLSGLGIQHRKDAHSKRLCDGRSDVLAYPLLACLIAGYRGLIAPNSLGELPLREPLCLACLLDVGAHGGIYVITAYAVSTSMLLAAFARSCR